MESSNSKGSASQCLVRLHNGAQFIIDANDSVLPPNAVEQVSTNLKMEHGYYMGLEHTFNNPKFTGWLDSRKPILRQLESRLPADEETLALLAGLTLQAENGNFKDDVQFYKILNTYEFFPNHLNLSMNVGSDFVKSVIENYKSFSNYDASTSEVAFLAACSKLQYYGYHRYSITGPKKTHIEVGIGPKGVFILDNNGEVSLPLIWPLFDSVSQRDDEVILKIIKEMDLIKIMPSISPMNDKYINKDSLMTIYQENPGQIIPLKAFHRKYARNIYKLIVESHNFYCRKKPHKTKTNEKILWPKKKESETEYIIPMTLSQLKTQKNREFMRTSSFIRTTSKHIKALQGGSVVKSRKGTATSLVGSSSSTVPKPVQEIPTSSATTLGASRIQPAGVCKEDLDFSNATILGPKKTSIARKAFKGLFKRKKTVVNESVESEIVATDTSVKPRSETVRKTSLIDISQGEVETLEGRVATESRTNDNHANRKKSSIPGGCMTLPADYATTTPIEFISDHLGSDPIRNGSSSDETGSTSDFSSDFTIESLQSNSELLRHFSKLSDEGVEPRAEVFEILEPLDQSIKQINSGQASLDTISSYVERKETVKIGEKLSHITTAEKNKGPSSPYTFNDAKDNNSQIQNWIKKVDDNNLTQNTNSISDRSNVNELADDVEKKLIIDDLESGSNKPNPFLNSEKRDCT